MYRHSFKIFGQSNAGETTFIEDHAKLYDNVNVFSCNKKARKRYITYSSKNYVLIINIENFANSIVILDDMGDYNRTPVVDVLCSKSRQISIFVKIAAHTVTDLNPKARDKSFIERVEKSFVY